MTTRYQLDPVHREKKKLRSQLTYHLRKPTGSGHTGTIWLFTTYLGTDIATMRRHIEAQFVGEMSWQTYAINWEVDHIVPLATATTVEEVRALFVYTNLRPLHPRSNKQRANCNMCN
jgi:5-methylcytosine-specific restriction endonuclease McrA